MELPFEFRQMSKPLRTVVASVHVDAPPEHVFAVIADPSKRFLTSNPFASMTVVGKQTAGVDTVYRWTFTLPFGLTFRFDEVVIEWVENERFAYRAVSGWEMEAINVLTPDNRGTCITFMLRYRFPGVWDWLIPPWLVYLGVRRAFANLKQCVEGGSRHGGVEVEQPVMLIGFTVQIAASPEDVFRVVGDPRSKKVWVPAIKRVDMITNQPLGLGCRYLASSGIDGIEIVFHEEIADWQPPYRVAYHGRSVWGRFKASWEIDAVRDGSRARYNMHYWFPGGRVGTALGELIAPGIRLSMSKLTATRIKEAVEQGQW